MKQLLPYALMRQLPEYFLKILPYLVPFIRSRTMTLIVLVITLLTLTTVVQAQVQWLAGNFNSTTPEQYNLSRQLILEANIFNAKSKETNIVVEVKRNVGPTNITLTGTSFKPDHNVTLPIGQFSTTDSDDNQHSYELVSGRGDSDNSLFVVRNNQLFLSTTKRLAGQFRFTIRIRSTDSGSNSIEKEFVIDKATYQPVTTIKVVNAFSPNNDGINDTWIVPELRYYDFVQIEVFDRVGNRLFYTKNPEKGWDGRNKDGQVVPGAYFYLILIDDIRVTQRGVITVHKK